MNRLLTAEETLLSLALMDPNVPRHGLSADHFEEPTLGAAWDAMHDLREAGELADPYAIHVAALPVPVESARLFDLLGQANSLGVSADAGVYAGRVRDAAERRFVRERANRAQLMIDDGQPLDRVLELLAEVGNPTATAGRAFRFLSGGSFILDQPETPPAVWGVGDKLLWARGEALVIAGGQGAGKTTVAQQVALGRAGLPEFAEVLGLPVVPSRGRVLYLAMDRPRQAARSFHRMVGRVHRAELDDRLVVWQGPPPSDMAQDTNLLARMCKAAGASTVFVDSLKDAAVGLTDDAVGAGWNRSRQRALAADVEVCEVHHTRKTSDDHKGAPGIDSVYGSTWITSGAGSVVLMTGRPGDPLVDFRHLKQPMHELGPWKLLHDHDAGLTTVQASVDLVQLAKAAGTLSVLEAACAMADTDKPSDAEKEKARRKISSLVRAGALVVETEGSKAQPGTWRAA